MHRFDRVEHVVGELERIAGDIGVELFECRRTDDVAGHERTRGHVGQRHLGRVQAVLAGDQPLSTEAVAALGAPTRGFPATEQLLFEDDLDATMTRIADGFVTWARAPRGGHRAPGQACLAGSRRLAQGVPWREAGAAGAAGLGVASGAVPPLPEGWKEFHTEPEGQIYFAHEDGRTSWVRPLPRPALFATKHASRPVPKCLR